MACCISGMLASSTVNGWSLLAALRGWLDVRMSRSAAERRVGVVFREGCDRCVKKWVMVVLVKFVLKWGSLTLPVTVEFNSEAIQ